MACRPAPASGFGCRTWRRSWPPLEVMLQLRESGRQARENGSAPTPDPRKFRDPERTATGARRASVALRRLQTLWFNTGTLCNITCQNCYIESSPRNDLLLYLTRDEV